MTGARSPATSTRMATGSNVRICCSPLDVSAPGRAGGQAAPLVRTWSPLRSHAATKDVFHPAGASNGLQRYGTEGPIEGGAVDVEHASHLAGGGALLEQALRQRDLLRSHPGRCQAETPPIDLSEF